MHVDAVRQLTWLCLQLAANPTTRTKQHIHNKRRKKYRSSTPSARGNGKPRGGNARARARARVLQPSSGRCEHSALDTPRQALRQTILYARHLLTRRRTRRRLTFSRCSGPRTTDVARLFLRWWQVDIQPERKRTTQKHEKKAGQARILIFSFPLFFCLLLGFSFFPAGYVCVRDRDFLAG